MKREASQEVMKSRQLTLPAGETGGWGGGGGGGSPGAVAEGQSWWRC